MARYNFSAVPDIFVDCSKQIDSLVGLVYAADGEELHVPTQPNFGLIDRPYPSDDDDDDDDGDDGAGADDKKKAPSWERLRAYVDHLNATAPERTSYKVVFAVRHGYGIHNVAEAKYGREAWNHRMACKDGDGTVVWADAYLVDKGIQQAKEIGALWSAAADAAGLALPSAICSSPLQRCVHTSRLAFAPLVAAAGQPFRLLVKENLREKLCDHTCDRRSPRAKLAAAYPEADFEPGFAEEDLLWPPYFESHVDEANEHHEARKRQALEDVWNGVGASDPAVGFGDHVVLVIHASAIRALLRLLGLGEFEANQGAVFAFLVKGESVD